MSQDNQDRERKVTGQIVRDSGGKLYFESLSLDGFDDDPVLVVRVEDYVKAIKDAARAGYDAARKELGK